MQTPSGTDFTAKFRYDGLRYEKSASGTTTRFVFDGPSQNYLVETNPSGVVQVAYTVEPRTYGNIVSRRASSATRYYHLDGLGSTRVLTNSSQTATDTYLNDAWGVPVVALGSTTNPFRWVGGPGYYFDTETGLFYVRARTYSSSNARWLSKDPLSNVYPWLSDSDLVKPYQYALSSPTLFIDPSGLRCTVCRWYREWGNQSLATADAAFLPGQGPYQLLANGQVYNANAKQLDPLGIPPFPFPPTKMGPLMSSNQDYVANGYLFFISADVCEDKPGDCRVLIKEVPWLADLKNGVWVLNPDTGKHFVNDSTPRTPTPMPIGPGARSPFIGQLKEPRNGCDKRIVFADLTMNVSAIRPLQLRSWGAQVAISIVDAGGEVARMNYKFDAWTGTTAPHRATFNLTGEVVSPKGNNQMGSCNC